MSGAMQCSSQPQFMTSVGRDNRSNGPGTPLIESIDVDQIVIPEKNSWKNLFSYIGPGFLVSIAYIDPGNFETDLQAGAQYKYELLWIILIASCAALVIQSLAARLGVVTGKHLAEHCRAEYPKVTNFVLWILAELAVVACDIPEVIGTAFALNMLFRIPLWCGVLITGLSTLMLLLLQQYGIRKLEFLIAFLVFLIATCFLVELGYSKPNSSEVVRGLFVPELKGNGATGLAISLLGAMVMPHNLFLHSALVLSRKVPRSVHGIKEACRFYMIESAFALTVAFLINISIISVSGAVCGSGNLNPEDQANCSDLDLNKASFLLKNVLGNWSSKLFAVALLASGQSSTITGTYAGQYVMQGFLDLRMTPWIRNLLTRSLAIIPSLIVSLIGGSSAAGELIIIASMILSFELPFALIPLLKFTSSKTKMGQHTNSVFTSVLTWLIGSFIVVINTYFLITSFVKLLLHNVQELLDRDPLLVFGEGEFGVTDMFYAAARGGSAEVFRLLLDHAMSPRCSTNCRDGEGGSGAGGGRGSVFRLEMMSRAVHAAARGGSVEMLRELIERRFDVSEYLDVRGSTVLHAAAGRGQLEVVKYLMDSFDIIGSTDNHGNTALHVAAYRGHQPVVEALVAASPSTMTAVNNAGDTFLHSAVAGFRTPGFRRLDRQMELMRYLIRERTADIQKIINLKNDAGLTVLHMALIGCAHPDLVELLMTTPSIDLNVEDANGMTPLALLKQQLRSSTSERLIKQIVSAGGVLNSSILRTRSAIVSQIKMQGGIASSPGTTFKVSDAEIFLFSGVGGAESGRPSSCSSNGKDDPTHTVANGAAGEKHGLSEKRLSSASRAKDRLKMMLRWPRHKEKMPKTPRKSEDSSPLDTIKKLNEHAVETPAPLRQKFTKTTALNGKRTLAVKSFIPSSSATKKKLNTKLIHGIMEAMPQLASSARPRSPTSTIPRSSMSSTPTPLAKLKDICLDDEISMVTPTSGKLKDIVLDSDTTSCSNSSMEEIGMGAAENSTRKLGCGNGRLINICFGAQGLTVEDSVSGQQTSKMFKQQCLRVS